MKVKLKNSFLLVLIFILSLTVNATNDNAIKLLTAQSEFTAGDDIVLKFSASEISQPFLYCTNSYGSTLVEASSKNDQWHYVLPEHITKKIGEVQWKLVSKTFKLTGRITIKPKKDVATLETYIGPPSIEAGGRDYTMLVVIPTDSLDNPLAENTLVNAKYQFLSTEVNKEIYTKNRIAYKTIYSQEESGRLLVSSESLNTNSKEFTVTVFSSIPTDFTITAKRPHTYADGNQITSFETSILKDKHGNIVSDGTFVNFFITNQKGHVLRASGTTINGIALAKMIHPDYESNWTIKGYVEGISESTSITLNYKQVIKEFDVEFSENNRTITVGPLKSFMTQIIPDGLQVELLVYRNNTLIETISKSSLDGFAHFKLKPSAFKNDTYNIVIKTAGLEKTITSVQLW